MNLGVKARPNLVVLKRTKMPAVLVEAGFINSDIDNQLFQNNFYDIAGAIADGIIDTLGQPQEERLQYRVQVGAFRNRNYADQLFNELIAQDYPAFIEEGNGFYRVQVGDYPILQEAVDMERRLKMAGYATIIVS